MSEKVKIRTVCIDTLTGIMNEMYMTSLTKPNHDMWADMGKGVWQLISALKELKFNTILVLGEPGQGKSTAMMNLPSKTNVWFNADNKNPVWIGGKKEYGKTSNPIAPYHIIPKSYKDIFNHIKIGVNNDMFEEDRYAILTGHIEDYKTGIQNKKRLKILGKLATKMQLEGRLESVFYTNVIKEGDETKYILETENDGYNTARSPMGLFEPIIESDYNFVINKLMEY